MAFINGPSEKNNNIDMNVSPHSHLFERERNSRWIGMYLFIDIAGKQIEDRRVGDSDGFNSTIFNNFDTIE